MTSLPKRGDRVRVTEVAWGDPNPSMVGLEFTLDYEPRELKRTPGFFSHAVPSTDTRQVAVKVEILERAHASKVEIIERDGYKFTLTCRKCGLAMKLEAGPLKRHDTTIDTCALCDEKRAEFARGMRRAVEIAERLCARDDAFYLKEAVEKELADG